MPKALKQLLKAATESGAFSAAEILVAKSGQLRLHEFTEVQVNTNERFFDLASLTKPLVTALLFMRLFDKRKLHPEHKVGDSLQTTTLAETTLGSLLNHTSGLKDWVDFLPKNYSPKKAINRTKITHEVFHKLLNDKKLISQSGKMLYSDLGYLVLGLVLEAFTETRLDKLWQHEIAKPLGLEKELFFCPVPRKKTDKPPIKNFIPSEICSRREQIMQGEVMDETSWILGGITGHAGLFGTAAGIHKILLELRAASLGKSKLFSKKAFATFCRPDLKRKLASRSFTLGFDTPTQPGSQSGKSFSKNTIGHLGYSGTSFWWDLDKDVWIILLTNRCYPSRQNKTFNELRPQIHDVIWQLPALVRRGQER